MCQDIQIVKTSASDKSHDIRQSAIFHLSVCRIVRGNAYGHIFFTLWKNECECSTWIFLNTNNTEQPLQSIGNSLPSEDIKTSKAPLALSATHRLSDIMNCNTFRVACLFASSYTDSERLKGSLSVPAILTVSSLFERRSSKPAWDIPRSTDHLDESLLGSYVMDLVLFQFKTANLTGILFHTPCL